MFMMIVIWSFMVSAIRSDVVANDMALIMNWQSMISGHANSANNAINNDAPV